MYDNNDFLIIYPKGINFEKLVNRDIQKFKNLNLIVPKCILGEVTRRTSYKLQDETKQKKYVTGNWEQYTVQLYSKKMKKLYGDSYRLGIELLLSKILYRNGYDKVNGVTYSYAFIKRENRDTNYKIEILDTSTTLGKNIVKRLRSTGSRFKENHSYNSKKLNYITKFFDRKRLTIDVEGAKSYIEKEFDKEKNRYKYISNLQKVVDIQNGIYRLAFSKETDGRFHNNFNQLNKELRKFIRYDNQPLCEIDLKNSIPFFLSSILSKSLTFEVSKITSVSLINYTLMFRKNAESIDYKEIELFHNLCVQGSIYLALKDEYVKQNNLMLIDEFGYFDENGKPRMHDINYKKLLKGELLQMLFAPNNRYHHVQKVFREMFPTLMNFIRECKKGSHKQFSHLLFQTESHVMLELIARKFNNVKQGKIPIFTIHDCIVTTQSHQNMLYEFMVENLNLICKKPPMLDLNKW